MANDISTKEVMKKVFLTGADAALSTKLDLKAAVKKAQSNQKAADIVWNSVVKTAIKNKSKYEESFARATQALTNAMVDQWNAENQARQLYKDNPDKLKQTLEDLELEFIVERHVKIFKDIEDHIYGYIDCCDIIDPWKVPSWSDVVNTIYARAKIAFGLIKKNAIDQAKTVKKMAASLVKLANIKLDADFQTERLNQTIAEIPLKIEDKIQEIKDKLDKFLGKFLVRMMNPDSSYFDINVLIAKIQAMLYPLIECISPLESIGGKVPIIGELAGMLSQMSQQSADRKISKEDLMKLVPNLPELSESMEGKARGVMDDITAVAMQLPLLLINIIVQMIDVIYSKLQIITSVIPLGSFFPLNLIPSIKSAIPRILEFMWAAPSLVYAAIKGLIKQKLAEAMALSIPQPHVDMDTLQSQIYSIEDLSADFPTPVFKPLEKKIDYNDVNTEKYSKISAFGYDKVDLARIFKNYKEIYDGSKLPLSRYIANNEKSVTTELSGVIRTKASPEDYRKKCCILPEDATQISNAISAGIKYDEINKVKSIFGGQYWLHEDYIRQFVPEDTVVTVETVKP